jgi:hypothetical protein
MEYFVSEDKLSHLLTPTLHSLKYMPQVCKFIILGNATSL